MQAREEQDRSQRSAQEQLAELQTQFQSMKVCICSALLGFRVRGRSRV